jgi:predicted HD superfamily hydrolase involved in NAD metabolism
VSLARFERTACGLGNRRSILLSYRDPLGLYHKYPNTAPAGTLSAAVCFTILRPMAVSHDALINQLVPLLSAKRLAHSLRVAATAKQLARHYGSDEDCASQAGILHDIAKHQTPNTLREMGIVCTEWDSCWEHFPSVWHALVGPVVVRHFFPDLGDTLTNPIRYHTTGYKTMDTLTMILFVADFIEPERPIPHRAVIEEQAYTQLHQAVGTIAAHTVATLQADNRPIHPYTHACMATYGPPETAVGWTP